MILDLVYTQNIEYHCEYYASQFSLAATRLGDEFFPNLPPLCLSRVTVRVIRAIALFTQKLPTVPVALVDVPTRAATPVSACRGDPNDVAVQLVGQQGGQQPWPRVSTFAGPTPGLS